MSAIPRRKIEQDLFGYALWQYTLGNKADLITWTSITPPEILRTDYLFRPYEQMPAHEQLALKLASGRILDVGAGSGTHSLYLQSQGKEVWALERSEFACKAMQSQGVSRILREDFFTFDPGQSFDTVLLLMNGGGIMGTLERAKIFFDKLKEVLAPDGRVLIHLSDISYVYFAYNLPLPLNHYYGEVIFYLKYMDYCGEPFPWLYLDADTLSGLAGKEGFVPEIIMHDRDGDILMQLSLK